MTDLTLLYLLLIQRRLQTVWAAKTLALKTGTEEDSNSNKPKKTAKNDGGGEVHAMFTQDNRRVLDDAMIDAINAIATGPGKTDYYVTSNHGRMHYTEVVKDIQNYMDTFCNTEKFRFAKKDYPDAFEFMEVYIKTMYLVERGLLPSSRVQGKEGQGKVCILWGDSKGQFQTFI